VSTAIALYTTHSAVLALITGLNIAVETIEKRSWIAQQITGFSLTLGLVAFAVLVLLAVALLPASIDFLPLTHAMKFAIDWG
jgi:uncharacterized BrkB/YihY/UPF0761 family membrane protein